MPENFGPERYGVHRKHRRIDADLMPVQQILQISPSKQSEAPPDTTSATEHLDMMIRHIAMDSMTDIIRVIRELENMSEMLRNESERVSREVSGYASLNQAATAAMKVIAESLNNGKSGHPKIRKLQLTRANFCSTPVHTTIKQKPRDVAPGLSLRHLKTTTHLKVQLSSSCASRAVPRRGRRQRAGVPLGGERQRAQTGQGSREQLCSS